MALCKLCEVKLSPLNKSGACSKHYHALRRRENQEYVIEEAIKRGRCFYYHIPLPEGLECPILFRPEQYLLAWEWDHIIPKKDKKHTISNLVGQQYSLKRLKDELRICVLTCLYHHRLITFNRRTGAGPYLTGIIPGQGLTNALRPGTIVTTGGQQT